MNAILVIAHAPLASAMGQCIAHVFNDPPRCFAVLDVQPNVPPEETLEHARTILNQLGCPTCLVMTDIFGATPCNVAQKLVDGVSSKLITGMNLSMLLRALSYREDTLDALVARSLAGASQGVMQVAITAPQNQNRRTYDQEQRDHQQ
jgi:PTS system ascorbate-specific IIA component